MARSEDHLNTEGFIEDPETFISATGLPRFNRRLSDKILAAFNHAYATGEIDIAVQLRQVLARLDGDAAPATGQRREDGTIALSRADLWIEFVEARNDYRAACERADADPAVVSRTLGAMKAAYKRWSSC